MGVARYRKSSWSAVARLCRSRSSACAKAAPPAALEEDEIVVYVSAAAPPLWAWAAELEDVTVVVVTEEL